jgi:hypothetical protein
MKNNFGSLVFYNNFNSGDLHVVRSLIKYVVNNFDGFKFRLQHPRDEKVLFDLGLPLSWEPVVNKFDHRGYYVKYGDLYINTQYLAYNGQYFNIYSATILTAWSIFGRALYDVFGYSLPKNYVQFLPQIDYTKYQISNMIDISYSNNNIIICNNDFMSEQSSQFDFNPVIKTLSQNNPDKTFYISNKTNVVGDNIKYVSDIINDPSITCDLNEISYLSTKCKFIIGRNSGPHTFCYVKENIMDNNKHFISFSPPSGLYGSEPKKWIDFGVSRFLEQDEHAHFHNLLCDNEKNRIEKIDVIIKMGGR